MNNLCLKSGVNYIDNDYGHIFGVNGGKITNVEVLSDSPGTVEISVKSKQFNKATSTITVIVGSDGYGVTNNLSSLFSYGDTMTVTGIPVDVGNVYTVRCYYE